MLTVYPAQLELFNIGLGRIDLLLIICEDLWGHKAKIITIPKITIMNKISKVSLFKTMFIYKRE